MDNSTAPFTRYCIARYLQEIKSLDFVSQKEPYLNARHRHLRRRFAKEFLIVLLTFKELLILSYKRVNNVVFLRPEKYSFNKEKGNEKGQTSLP